MSTIIFLIGFPLIVAILLLLLKAEGARDIIVKVAAAIIAAASIYLVVQHFGSGGKTFVIPYAANIGYAMMAIEVVLAIIIIVVGVMKKQYLAPIFATQIGRASCRERV